MKERFVFGKISRKGGIFIKTRKITALALVLLMLSVVPMVSKAESTEATLPEATAAPIETEPQEIAQTSDRSSDVSIQGTVVVASETSDAHGVNAATITAIASAITTVAAIVTPHISSVLKARSEERKARFEQYSPQVYAAVDEFTTAYSKFHRLKDYTNAGQDYSGCLDDEVPDIYKNFSAAAYKVISLVPDHDIRKQIVTLLEALEKVKHTSAEEDALFQKIAANLAYVISP